METPTPLPGTQVGAPFSLRMSAAAPRRVEARLVGDLDLANAPLVRDELLRTIDEGIDGLSIDLGDLTFLDSTGIAALVVVRKHALERGIDLRVHSPQTAVNRVLEACGVDVLFGVGAAAEPDPAC